MRKQSLLLLIVGLLLAVILPSVVQDDLSDFAKGLIRGVGIGLVALSVIVGRKDRRARRS